MSKSTPTWCAVAPSAALSLPPFQGGAVAPLPAAAAHLALRHRLAWSLRSHVGPRSAAALVSSCGLGPVWGVSGRRHGTGAFSSHGWAQMSVRNCFIRGSVVRYVQVRGGREHLEVDPIPTPPMRADPCCGRSFVCVCVIVWVGWVGRGGGVEWRRRWLPFLGLRPSGEPHELGYDEAAASGKDGSAVCRASLPAALAESCEMVCACAAQLPSGSVDVDLLHDATRREARGS